MEIIPRPILTPTSFVYALSAAGVRLSTTPPLSLALFIADLKLEMVLCITNHHNLQNYPNQKILHVRVLNQVYLVPYVIEKDGTVFLKTLYPSSMATKEYLEER